MPHPVDFSILFLGYLALVFGGALCFFLFGGWRQLLTWLQPTALPTTLSFGPWPMIAAVAVMGSAAVLAPTLLPGAGLAAGMLLLSSSQSRPAEFWGLRQRNLGKDLRQSLAALLTILWPVLLLLFASSSLYLALGLPLQPQPALLRFLEARELGQMLPFLIYALIIAPIWEEVFFRGTLFPWLAGRLPAPQAQWLSALAFGAVHLHGPTLIPLTVFGAFLVGIYRTSGSLIPAILVHALFNANTCALLLLGRAATE
ncbi:MAG: CPBP family intramembrane metalloprotease [Verrucomicrobia bacterium]|nr:CPBP family intramembrane metalloprotease [Verrucomicrobiota bacterium]